MIWQANRGGLARLVLALVLALISSSRPSQAADKPAAAEQKKEGEHKDAKAGHADHSHSTGPALSFYDIHRYDLGIWTLIVFGALLFLLTKFAWKPFMDGLQAREDGIANAFAAAETARREAVETSEKLRQQLAQANDKAREIIEEARKDALKVVEEMTAKARAEIQAEKARAEHEIQTAREQAMQDLFSQAVQLSMQTSTKILQRELSVSHTDQRRMLEEALAELSQISQGPA